MTVIKTINCNVVISMNNVTITPQQLLDYVKNCVPKCFIDYGNSVQYVDGNGQRQFVGVNQLSNAIDKFGLYFIFSDEEDKLLYVGKSKNLSQRLKNHLVQCNVKTYSHIEQVHQYLHERKLSNLSLKIKYCTIQIDNPKYNATVEGVIIDYILSHKTETFFSDCWNVRED